MVVIDYTDKAVHVGNKRKREFEAICEPARIKYVKTPELRGPFWLDDELDSGYLCDDETEKERELSSHSMSMQEYCESLLDNIQRGLHTGKKPYKKIYKTRVAKTDKTRQIVIDLT